MLRLARQFYRDTRDLVARVVTSKKAQTAAVVGTGAVVVSSAAATPTMPAISFPLDIASIVTAVGVAGASMLAAWAGLWVAFRLIRKLIKRVGSAV